LAQSAPIPQPQLSLARAVCDQSQISYLCGCELLQHNKAELTRQDLAGLSVLASVTAPQAIF